MDDDEMIDMLLWDEQMRDALDWFDELCDDEDAETPIDYMAIVRDLAST